MKIRLQFEKNIKYISHLDLMKAMQKILKRTGLPLKYSEGFNPHMVLNIANPLPLGIIGKKEFADFELKTDHLSFGEVKEKLKAASPQGIVPLEIYTENLKNFNQTDYAEYEIDILTCDSEKIKVFLEQDSISVEKKAKGKIKTVELKELIYHYQTSPLANGIHLSLRCACGNEKTLNPLLLQKAMIENGIQIDAFSPVRTGFYDKDGNGF